MNPLATAQEQKQPAPRAGGEAPSQSNGLTNGLTEFVKELSRSAYEDINAAAAAQQSLLHARMNAVWAAIGALSDAHFRARAHANTDRDGAAKPEPEPQLEALS